MANSPHIKINLLGKSEVSFRDDILKWGINIGRIIIVVTELVAVGALAYRFTLDRKIVDLHDQIKKADLFVEAQGAKEADYRSIQTRLANIKTINDDAENKVSIMKQILNSMSTGDFSSTNLTVNQTSISINGVAFSIFPINNFIDELKQNPNVTSISLDDISSTDEGVKFKMTIELKQTTKLPEDETR
ncbi:MAG TPA: PilN domain-containing protein [Patescibacteria group bacterium]|nr:PilN domain-containing protein [Patescibacteria group bacterium]